MRTLSWCKGTSVWLLTRQVVDSISTWGNEIYEYFRSSLWCRDKTRSWVPAFKTQSLQNSVEIGKWDVLTLGSLWLSYYMRDTAWSYKNINKRTVVNIRKCVCQIKSKFKIFFIQIDSYKHFRIVEWTDKQKKLKLSVCLCVISSYCFC